MKPSLFTLCAGVAAGLFAFPSGAGADSAFNAALLYDATGNLVLRWPGDTGKHYRVESSGDLKTWTALPGDSIGSGAELSVSVQSAGETRKFWRVVATDGSGLAASGGNGSVMLTWNGEGGSRYVVKRGPQGGPYTGIALVAAPGYTDTGLANGVTYYYVMAPYSGSGEGPASVEVAGTPVGNSSEIYLSDLSWLMAYGSSGDWDYTFGAKVQRDFTAIYWGGDGRLSINGRPYARGISAQSKSEVCYDLGKRYTTFISDIGSASGQVAFEVYCDGRRVYSSPTLNETMAPTSISIPVTGVSELRLVLQDGVAGTKAWGTWGNARLQPGTPAVLTQYSAPRANLAIGNSLTVKEMFEQRRQYAMVSGVSDQWDTADGYHDTLSEQWAAGTGTGTPRAMLASGHFTECTIQPNSNEYLDVNLRANLKPFYDFAKENHVRPEWR